MDASRVLTIQASCRLEDTWVFTAHAPPPGACENKIDSLKLLANLQEEKSFIEVVYVGIKEKQQEEGSGGAETVHRDRQQQGTGVHQFAGSASCGERVGKSREGQKSLP